MEDQNESYPAGWTRVEILSDRAIVTCRPGRHSADGLLRRVLSVLDVEAVRSGCCTSGHVPPSFVYHVSPSGTAVFNYRGEPRNAIAASRAPDVHRKARLAAQYDGPHPLEAARVVFPLRRTAAGMEISGPEAYSQAQAALETGRDDTPAPVKAARGYRGLAKTVSFSNPPPPPPIQRIDGLTPHQCLQAFTAAQRDQRTFEIVLRADQLQPGAVVRHDRDWWFVVENERISNGFKRRLTLRAEGRDTVREAPTMMDFRVQRSTVLTPAQRDCARRMWSCLLRHDVEVSAQRAAERAPSVAIADEGLEIEALAADVL